MPVPEPLRNDMDVLFTKYPCTIMTFSPPADVHLLDRTRNDVERLTAVIGTEVNVFDAAAVPLCTVACDHDTTCHDNVPFDSVLVPPLSNDNVVELLMLPVQRPQTNLDGVGVLLNLLYTTRKLLLRLTALIVAVRVVSVVL